ncbi:MAG: hypothetical protein F2664_00020 [Actinobacteria bacterium]|uniref:Unannotated protein n=1 Tax=freshwater metagenome TaxID=449393 RepID=A0A6J6NBV5_9ZZZZ|nr:hypothetical protein [Actinomycetota bacterium]
MKLSYLRMLAYSMIAVGLINWDYQRGNPHVITHSLIIILPGVILLLSTLINPLRKLVTLKGYAILWLAIALATLTYAFLN